MEKARGISITSAALQFDYRDHVVNLVDTPGHSDFSEDTYRVLSAVDAAVMLVDAAKGLEPQTLKLFRVCAHRGIPVITVINKWDRPGLDALALMDEIEKRIGLKPTPLTWPVGADRDFQGVLDRRTGELSSATPAPGGGHPRARAAPRPRGRGTDGGDGVAAAGRGRELLAADDRPARTRSSPGATTPMLFASTLLNSASHSCSTCSWSWRRPGGDARPGRVARPVDDEFGAASSSRSSPAWTPAPRPAAGLRPGLLGVLSRGMVVTHAAEHRTALRPKYAQAVFGRERPGRDRLPGDIVAS